KKELFSRTTEAIHSAIRRMEKQKNAGAAKLLPGQHRILVKIQDLNLKDSAVRSFSEEFRKIWEDFEHCRASGSGRYRSEIKKLESGLGLRSTDIKKAVEELQTAEI